MKNMSKSNWKIDESTTEKFNRYGIRKYNVGAASVAILSGLFFLGGADAQAAENASSQANAQAVASESGSNATSNAWEKAITTVVEKEKTTAEVAPKAAENQTAPKETVVTAPKVETREATTTPRRARRARSVGNNPDEVTPSSQPSTTDSTGSQPSTTGSTASQPSTTDSTASQPTST